MEEDLPVYGASKDVLVPENQVGGVARGGRGQVTWNSHLDDDMSVITGIIMMLIMVMMIVWQGVNWEVMG